MPTSAPFRHHTDWAVFVANGETADRTIVELGRRNPDAAEVVAGLEEGDRVIVYPSDRIEDGVGVVARASSE